MNCETCDSQLLDLLYEELAPATAEEVRMHLADCASCTGAYEKISAGMSFAMHLPMLEPSPAVESAIMDVARSRISGLPQTAVARPIEVERDAEGGVIERMVDWLRDFATGPQAAMATVMLLVMAIGVWYVPRGAPTTFEATGTTLMSPDPEGEAAPTALAMDEEEPAEFIAEEAASPSAVSETRRRRENEAPRRRQRAPRARSARGGSMGAATSDRFADMEALEGVFAEAPAAPAPEPIATPTMRRGRSMPSNESVAAASGAASLSVAAADEADDDRTPEGDESLAVSMHQLAQGLRSRGQCPSSARHYESLLVRFPRYARAPEAMVELADCYRRMGHLDKARRWLRRAQQDNRTSAIATRALRQVDSDAANSGPREQVPAAAEAQ